MIASAKISLSLILRSTSTTRWAITHDMNYVKCILFFCVAWSFNLAFSATSLSFISGWDVLRAQSTSSSAEGKKGLVIVFMSAKCPCSQSHSEEVKNLHAHFPDFSFVVVNSNSDETEEMAKTYFKSVGFDFPVIKDKNAELADRYAALKTPHAFLISPEGKIVYQGGVSSSRIFAKADKKFLRQALNEIREGKIVSTPEGRTLGCAITRGENNVW